MSLGKLVIGVAAGVAAGVAVGVLLAPEKGTDLREKISGGEYLDDIKEYWNDCLAQLTDKLGWKEEALQFAHANVGGDEYGSKESEGQSGAGSQSRSAGSTGGVGQSGTSNTADTEGSTKGTSSGAGAKGGKGGAGGTGASGDSK